MPNCNSTRNGAGRSCSTIERPGVFRSKGCDLRAVRLQSSIISYPHR